MHILLCDKIDSGKSAFLVELLHRLDAAKEAASGWATPAFIEGGEKRGHDFVAIENGQIKKRIPFTRMHPFPSSASFSYLAGDSPEAAAFRACPYHFNSEVFERAEGIAEKAAFPEGKRSVFIIDEIGPLELFAQSGFYLAAHKAFEKAPKTVTVVRKGLEEDLRRAFPLLSFTVSGLADKAGIAQALALPLPDL